MPFWSALLIPWNIRGTFDSIYLDFHHAMLQVASIITTTGYATTDFNLWPTLSKTVILILMFCGGCAGSTAGGLKISRVVMLFKTVLKEFKKALHPRSVGKIHFEGKPIEDSTISSVTTYFVIYMICFLGLFLLISFENFGFETNLSAVAACFNNIGPGFGAVGPVSNYNAYTDFSKIILSFAMLLGRLEIFPLIIMLSARTWRNK